MAKADNVLPALDDFARFRRYLHTSDEVSANVSECVSRLTDSGKGEEVIRELISTSSNDDCVVRKKLIVNVLALCTTKDLKTKQAAYDAVNDVCDTPPLLFHFLTCVAKQSEKGKSGFGRAKRKAIAKWYNSKNLKDLAVFVTRYRRRSSWSHVDLIRLAHTKPGNDGVSFILKYITKGLVEAKKHLESDNKEVSSDLAEVVKYLEAVEKVKHSHDEHEVARLVEQFQLSREHVPTWFLKESNEVWSALVPHMPLSVVLYHLNKMASIGLLNAGPQSSANVVIKHLESDELVRKNKIHPFSIQMAVKSYEGGRAGRTTPTWTPNPEISKALQSVFYKAIELYEPTGSRYLLAVDVSSSMFNNLNGAPLLMSSIWAAASMSLPILRKETNRRMLVVAGNVVALDVAGKDLTVEQICGTLEKHKKDGFSNLSLITGWASEKKEAIDTLVVFTDQIRSHEGRKLIEAFRKYRTDMTLPLARLVIVSYNKGPDHTNVEDAGILLLKGLHPDVPEVIRNFAAGKLDSTSATG